MPWLWSCTTSRHQNPSEKPSCTLLYLMEAMGSLNQYGFSHSSVEEHLETAMCSNTDMFLHWLVYRIKDRFSFRLREPDTGQAPTRRGSCPVTEFSTSQGNTKSKLPLQTPLGKEGLHWFHYVTHLIYRCQRLPAAPVTLSTLAQSIEAEPSAFFILHLIYKEKLYK